MDIALSVWGKHGVHRRRRGRREIGGTITHTPLLYGGLEPCGAKRFCSALLLSAAGCKTIPHAPPRYIVSSEPMLFLGAPPNPSLCVAVDPARVNGVWLWHPGRSGCASRTSSLMDATMIAGTVARLASDAVEASLQINLMIGGPRHVRLDFATAACANHRPASMSLPSGAPSWICRRLR